MVETARAPISAILFTDLLDSSPSCSAWAMSVREPPSLRTSACFLAMLVGERGIGKIRTRQEF